MAYVPPKVYYSATLSGTYTQLTGIQSISLNRGRQRVQDPFQANTVTIELIPATSYSPALAVGQFIDIKDSNSALSTETYFCGKITDIERNYGIPYNSGTGSAPQDRIVITAVGGLGLISSNLSANWTWSAGLSETVAQSVASAVNVKAALSGLDNVTVQAQTNYNGSALEILNMLAVTGQFGILDTNTYRGNYSATPDQIQFYRLYFNAVLPNFYFKDTGSPSSNIFKYKEIQYLSGAQTAFTQVQINPEGLASQQASSGSGPWNTLAQNTFNESTTQAASLASYLLAMSNETAPTPFQITTDSTLDASGSSAQSLTLMDSLFGVNSLCQISFRGTIINAFVQGYSAMFYPDRVTVTYYFSPSLGSPFILDSTSFGVLDTNRLGYP